MDKPGEIFANLHQEHKHSAVGMGCAGSVCVGVEMIFSRGGGNCVYLEMVT